MNTKQTHTNAQIKNNKKSKPSNLWKLSTVSVAEHQLNAH